MQMRISRRRSRSQPTAIELAERPGLALTKACSTSAGVTVSGAFRSMYSAGIFTTARALRTVSK